MFGRKKSRSQSDGALKCSSSSPGRGKGSRRRTLPANPRKAEQPEKINGIMKYVTEDESVHSKYGSESKENERSLEFSEIHIREYARTVGDNPSCSSGPPVSISWEYDPETKIVSVEEYEKNRPPRRTHFEMVLPRDVRQQMLRKEWDVTQNQIAAAVRANIKVKNQRRMTVNNINKMSLEEKMESAGKGLMRGLGLRKSTSKHVEELHRQHSEAQKARERLATLDEGKTVEFPEDETPTDPMEEEEEGQGADV